VPFAVPSLHLPRSVFDLGASFSLLLAVRLPLQPSGDTLAIPRANTAFVRLGWAVSQQSSSTRGLGGIGCHHPRSLGKAAAVSSLARRPVRAQADEKGNQCIGRCSRHNSTCTRMWCCGCRPGRGNHVSCCCRLPCGACFLAFSWSYIPPPLFPPRIRRWFNANFALIVP